MAQHRLTSQAETDLRNVWEYIAQNSQRNADRLINSLVERFTILSEQPYLGRARSDLAPDLRSFPVGNYLIIYRPTDYGVQIVRVIHGSRDIEGMFEP